MPLERVVPLLALTPGKRYATKEGRIYTVLYRIGYFYLAVTDDKPRSIRLFTRFGEGRENLVQEMD